MVPKYTKKGVPKAAPDDPGPRQFPDRIPTSTRGPPRGPKMEPKGSQKGAKREPEGSQKGAQIQPKSIQSGARSPEPTESRERPEGDVERRRKSAEGTQKMVKMYKNGKKIKPKWEYEGHKREGDAESDPERRRKTRRDAQ